MSVKFEGDARWLNGFFFDDDHRGVSSKIRRRLFRLLSMLDAVYDEIDIQGLSKSIYSIRANTRKGYIIEVDNFEIHITWNEKDRSVEVNGFETKRSY